ncbi:MAG: hypothetical protein WGN25_00890 [Candidatus Electrothrix sp. GW3-4]|uniref:hypothetical protein n=1 Tax=Candidatus Electrothrix sp. GW3-4 TaxID=3126740 RepID=UPI0030D53166
MNRYTALLLVLLSLLPLEAAASWLNHENAFCLPAAKHIEPKHVYALSRLVNKETQSIRQLMGVTKVSHTLLQVANAEPREVYFQAVNLYGKISRLHHNLTARSILDHNLPPVEQNIRPADVWAVLSVVLIQLDEIKEEYDITTHVQFPEIEEKRVPTDVYQSLLLTIRQVNQMLQEQPYTYSDVYQEISTALYCALNIYNRFPGMQMHSQPPLQPGKTAEDVFTELIETYQTTRDIMLTSGLKMLDLSTVPTPDIKPGDIYDLAILITSELKFLHSKAVAEKPSHDATYPGIKFPSHVLQRLTYLHNHLRSILKEVQKNPHWLSEQQS